jgi:endogenous inhibitor of DNA gyrase (YacG/DUF329 family)
MENQIYIAPTKEEVKEKHRKITEYRTGGMGFKDISRKLRIPESTVKTYCWRHKIQPSAIAQKVALLDESTKCPQCGTIIHNELLKKPKKFCCDKCRHEWWNNHREAMQTVKSTMVKCAFCGREFLRYPGSKRKYCCHPCYIKARYGEVYRDE